MSQDRLSPAVVEAIMETARHEQGQAPAPPPAPIIIPRPGFPRVTLIGATIVTATKFIQALAIYMDRPYAEVEAAFSALSFNLWPLVDAPQGWGTLAHLLTDNVDKGEILKLAPTIH